MSNQNSPKRRQDRRPARAPESEDLPVPAGHEPVQDFEAAMMRLLEELDRLRGAALQAGDLVLHKDLDAAFHSCLTRYCDSKHVELERRMRGSVNRPKSFMN